ncbi:Oxoglutarate and iron-dependent oxygenase degradation C-term-domain-containing protein [Podospora fimiseda]|uniref:Oxoglutarate and iron-dependent oxygenase degradation C-term-domain-containing protein n=1 Tax=Podospora fimiseda TaxID=252190 RepID=A0AAN7BEH8_9PEZI|nr:Oxoglutarate and iron-dependent oxygenase degradation C-term-domain-containing protein [Podospora fimiseda]
MVFQAGLLDLKDIPSRRHDYLATRPFPHLIIQDAVQDHLLRLVRSEVVRHLRLNFDENNVYRIRRSTHLANISNHDEYAPELLPNLTKLRDALNSLQFRDWLSRITGVGPLSGTASSMALNMYMPGDRLLIHDDCNPKSRNRRVSFILYLTDPDDAWKEEWGGGLRLYASQDKTAITGDVVKLAHPDWCKYIPPCFNQLVFFGVRPGETYHEVEEVLSSGNVATDQTRRRMAISGWFHAAQEGDEGFNEEFSRADKHRMDELHRLKALAHGLQEPRTVCVPFANGNNDASDTDSSLLPLDVQYLSQYIAPELLEPDRMKEATRCFGQTSTLHLQPFLCEKWETKLQDYIAGGQQVGSGLALENTRSRGWSTAGPPDKQRFLYLEVTESADSTLPRENPVLELLGGPLQSAAFRRWLSQVTGLDMSRCSGQHLIVRQFRRGLDYILADLYGQSPPQLDYTLDLSPFGIRGNQTRATEKAMDTGGVETYTITGNDTVELGFAGQHDPGAGVERGSYRSTPSWNKLSAVLRRDVDTQGLVTYLSRAASGDRLDIKGRVHL